MPLLASTIFKSEEEERRKLTERVKCLHLTIFYTGKEIVFSDVDIRSVLGIGPYASFGIRIGIGKEKNSIRTSLISGHKLQTQGQ